MIQCKHFNVFQSNLLSEWVGLPSFVTHLFSQTSSHGFLCQLWLDNAFKSCQQVCPETVGLHQALFFQRVKVKYHWITADRWTHGKPPRCRETHPSSTVTSRAIAQLGTPEFTSRLPSNIEAKSGASFTCFKPQTFWFLGCSSISMKISCSLGEQKSLANHPTESNTPGRTSWFYVELKYPRRIHSKINSARYMRWSQRGQEHL